MNRPFSCLPLVAGLVSGCGNTQPLPPPGPPQAASAPQTIAIQYIVPLPRGTPLQGAFAGAPLQIRSVLFAEGPNADGQQELQIVVSDVPEYCAALSQFEAADGVVARLRLVALDAQRQSVAPTPGLYEQRHQPTWSGAVRDIPPPATQAGADLLPPGLHLTGGFVALDNGCSTEQLNPTFVGSALELSAVGAEAVSGTVRLHFSSRVGTTLGLALAGDFVATPCPALAAQMRMPALAPFVPAASCRPR